MSDNEEKKAIICNDIELDNIVSRIKREEYRKGDLLMQYSKELTPIEQEWERYKIAFYTINTERRKFYFEANEKTIELSDRMNLIIRVPRKDALDNFVNEATELYYKVGAIQAKSTRCEVLCTFNGEELIFDKGLFDPILKKLEDLLNKIQTFKKQNRGLKKDVLSGFDQTLTIKDKVDYSENKTTKKQPGRPDEIRDSFTSELSEDESSTSCIYLLQELGLIKDNKGAALIEITSDVENDEWVKMTYALNGKGDKPKNYNGIKWNGTKKSCAIFVGLLINGRKGNKDFRGKSGWKVAENIFHIEAKRLRQEFDQEMNIRYGLKIKDGKCKATPKRYLESINKEESERRASYFKELAELMKHISDECQ